MLIDSHCHLNRLKLDGVNANLDSIIDNAKNAGVEKIISVCVDLAEVNELRQITDKYDDIYHTVGVHPSEWSTKNPTASQLIKLADYHKCIAIGETGLDYHYNDESTNTAQIDKFIQHIEASKQTQKPLIIHTRAAKKDTLDIMRSEKVNDTSGVMHCFTEDWDMAKQSLDMGFCISFSGILTFKNAEGLRNVARKMPLDRILIETDAPYLAPVPKRGKDNYPEYVKYIAQFLADLRGVSFDEISQITAENTERLFLSK